MAFHFEPCLSPSPSILCPCLRDVDAMINAAKTCRSSPTRRKLNLFARNRRHNMVNCQAKEQSRNRRHKNTHRHTNTFAVGEPVDALMVHSGLSDCWCYVKYLQREMQALNRFIKVK